MCIRDRDWAEAVKALRKAATLVPQSLPVRLNLGKTLVEAGEGAEGEALLRLSLIHI